MKLINGKEFSIIGTNEEENIWYMSHDTGIQDEFGDEEKEYVVAWGNEVIQSDTDIDRGSEGILWFGDDQDEAFGTFIFKMNNLEENEEFQKFVKKFV